MYYNANVEMQKRVKRPTFKKDQCVKLEKLQEIMDGEEGYINLSRNIFRLFLSFSLSLV
jgi:hypothetical protein